MRGVGLGGLGGSMIIFLLYVYEILKNKKFKDI